MDTHISQQGQQGQGFGDQILSAHGASTKRRSVAGIDGQSGGLGLGLTFYCRSEDERSFHEHMLTTLDDRTRTLVKSWLDQVSSGPDPTYIHDREISATFDPVTLDDIIGFLRNHTVLGEGASNEIHIVVYDRDPTQTRAQAVQQAQPATRKSHRPKGDGTRRRSSGGQHGGRSDGGCGPCVVE